MSTKFIIACAGKASRWNNYMNTRKHMIEIEGEQILDRTVRLIRDRIPTAEVTIVAFEECYQRENTTLWIPPMGQTVEHYDLPAIYTTAVIWNDYGRTVLLFGDIYFTDEAMDKICYDMNTDWNFYGRAEASVVTGSPYGELWGLSFYPEYINTIDGALGTLCNWWYNRKIERFKHWELYRYMNGIHPDDHRITNHFVEINDWTEDFDYPEDYDDWIAHRYPENAIV